MWIKLKQLFICWYSREIKDIHTIDDGINRIPDSFNEWTCKRCYKTFKLK
jgi:hypothetical protein